MKGIQFVLNDKGEKTAVLVDIKKCGEIWEDFYDALIAEIRSKEPRESIESVKKRLIALKKLED
ncbi:hypothetical protein ES705_05480 [subsurface metagenome]